MPEAPGQSNSNPNPGEGGGSGDGNGNGGEGGNTPPANNTPPASNNNEDGNQFDPEKLSQDQINQILEKNELIWKNDRISQLREKSKKFDQVEKEKQQAEQKQLEEQGKFKELSEKQTSTIEELQSKVQEMTVNQALTNKLSPEGVVDLEGALKLIDRSKIEVSDDGAVSGLDEAVEALKNDKAYLFNSSASGKPQVGNPTNPGNGGGSGEAPKFKASQLRGPEGAKFYQEHKEEILKAQAEGRIEQD